MYTLPDYRHGAYGMTELAGAKIAAQSQNAIVIVGTAPVNTVSGGEKNVNRPIAVQNMAEAKKFFGYSDQWADYTLCEAMHVFFDLNGVGPLVLINVLDPVKHKADQKTTASLTPANGRITIAAAGNIIMDSVSVDGKTKGTDYSMNYSPDRAILTIAEVTPGALGSEELSVSYDTVDLLLLPLKM